MVDRIVDSLADLDDGVLLLINGLGSVTTLELSGVFNIVAEHLERRGVALHGAMVGTLTPALDMRGLSVTMTAVRPEWLEWWTRPTGAPGFPPASLLGTPEHCSASATPPVSEQREREWSDPVMAAFESAAADAYEKLTAWDQASGDGDFGDNLTRGLANARRHETEQRPGFAAASATFLNGVGGSSGPLLGLLFESISRSLDHAGASRTSRDAAYAAGIRGGLTAIQRVGEAQPGDRTMVDALHPAARRLAEGGTLHDAALAAIAGARSTSHLTARRGRASYVGNRALGTPDPGAAGIAILLTAIADPAMTPHSRARTELQRFFSDPALDPTSFN